MWWELAEERNLMIITSNHFTKPHADCRFFCGLTGARFLESDQLFDCTVKRRQLMGQTVYRYYKDGKLLTDGRQSWRCAKKSPLCPGRLYTIHETFHCLRKSHNHTPDAADSNAKQAIDKVKHMASTSQTTHQRIYCAVTGTIPPVTMSRLPGEDAVKKIAQRARRKMNPRPELQSP